ncbi:MAG TPA: hypothetical protein VJ837_04900, partial [Candidatus Paceibacterota bacterium]|nr:hypothetical protein [Candidatus Paceibacterota bacterium]
NHSTIIDRPIAHLAHLRLSRAISSSPRGVKRHNNNGSELKAVEEAFREASRTVEARLFSG